MGSDATPFNLNRAVGWASYGLGGSFVSDFLSRSLRSRVPKTVITAAVPKKQRAASAKTAIQINDIVLIRYLLAPLPGPAE